MKWVRPARGFTPTYETLTYTTITRPWETAPIPEVQHLFECPNVIGWHDEAFYSGDELYWYEGDEEYPAGWLCDGCHFHIRKYHHGFDSPEMHTLYDDLNATPTLAEEIERRFGKGKWEYQSSLVT